jgi:hypothetical protein
MGPKKIAINNPIICCEEVPLLPKHIIDMIIYMDSHKSPTKIIIVIIILVGDL